jgi:hypothetical protein
MIPTLYDHTAAKGGAAITPRDDRHGGERNVNLCVKRAAPRVIGYDFPFGMQKRRTGGMSVEISDRRRMYEVALNDDLLGMLTALIM